MTEQEKNGTSEEPEARAYDRFAERAREIFAASGEKSLASLEKAIELARQQLVKAGELTQREGEHMKSWLRRDVEQTARFFGTWRDQAREQMKPAKIQAGFLDLTAHLAHSASDMFTKLAEWADSTASYHTGQVTAPGTLRCRECDKEMHFKKSGNIPPCPACKHTDFRRVG